MSYHPNVDPNPFWAQAAWFIDPANSSGVASDLNTGLDALHPVLSYNGGVAAKWGTISPTLRQDTTLTWMSSQAVGGADPVVFNPVCATKTGGSNDGAIAVLRGTTTVSHNGALAGVIAKNRVTGQLLTADLGVALLPAGTLVKNTQAGKTSFAFVYGTVAGTTYTLSQPIAPGPFPMPVEPVVTEVNTWANADTFQILTVPQVNWVRSSPTLAAFNITTFLAAPVQATNIAVACADGITGDSIVVLDLVSCAVCYFDSQVAATDPSAPLDTETTYYNCFLAGSANSCSRRARLFAGVLSSVVVEAQADWDALDYDCILDNGIGVVLAQLESPNLGAVCIQNGTTTIDGIVATCVFPRVGSTNVIWGNGTLNLTGTSRLVYASAAGAAVTTFRMAGGLKMNGQTNASTYNNTTGVWTANIALTPANLDDAAAFAGLAIRPGGASITNSQTI